MSMSLNTLIKNAEIQSNDVEGVCVGKIVGIAENGRAIVDYPGNQSGPIEANTAADTSNVPQDKVNGLPVILVVDREGENLPVIIGVVRDTFFTATQPEESQEPDKTLSLEAKDEIVMRCGKSSLTMRNDGKIVVSGTQLTSRATCTNRIKGGSVAIN